jgi:4-diphosphocytidyl-2-C-methyl-D-erythritol kinase
MKINAYAKINLFLDVKKRLDNGYHLIESVMIPIDLHDSLSFTLTNDKEIYININEDIPIYNNLVFKVASYMMEKYQLNQGVKIDVDKQIPLGAGLAGGSADAAATIHAIDELFELNMGNKEKEDIAKRFGSDIVFCLYNRPAIIKGTGDQIEFIEIDLKDDICLVLPGVHSSTKDVYKNIDTHTYPHKDLYEFVTSLNKPNLNERCFNNMSLSAFELYPELKRLYDRVSKTHIFHMSGSGSTLFSLVSSHRDDLKEQLETQNIQYLFTNIKKHLPNI